MFALRKKSAIFGRGTRGETKKVNQICSWKLFMVTCPTKVDRYYQGNYIKELQRKWQVPKFSSRQNCYFWLYLGSRQNNNGTVIWFRNMLSINKFWKNGEVFLTLLEWGGAESARTIFKHPFLHEKRVLEADWSTGSFRKFETNINNFGIGYFMFSAGFRSFKLNNF